MNFNSLNKIFEDKFTISKKLLREEASLKSKKEKSKKKLTESIDRNLTERDWKLTIPGSFRDDMLNAGEEEDFDKVKNILIDMCNYVLEHIDESNFDLDDQEYVIEEFEDFIEELEYVEFEDEDEANYYLNDLYDLLDNTDIFLGLREGLNESSENFVIKWSNGKAVSKSALQKALNIYYGNNSDINSFTKEQQQEAVDFYEETLAVDKAINKSINKNYIIYDGVKVYTKVTPYNIKYIDNKKIVYKEESDEHERYKDTFIGYMFFITEDDSRYYYPTILLWDNWFLLDDIKSWKFIKKEYKNKKELPAIATKKKKDISESLNDTYNTGDIIQIEDDYKPNNYYGKFEVIREVPKKELINTHWYDIPDKIYEVKNIDSKWFLNDLSYVNSSEMRPFKELKEEKITGGNMEQEDINIIQSLIDDFDSLEDANKDVLSITWNFGRRNSDNKMTAGVDIYFLAKDSEENLQQYLKQVEDIILSDGYKFDDSLGYDLDPWKSHTFGDGYHTQIIEDVKEVIEESFGYKPSFDEWYFQETGVNTSDLTDEQYDELWADEDLMNHYRKFCDGLDESLNESWVLFFDEDGINHAGSDGAHKFNLSPKIIERKIKSSDYHLPNWAESYIILSDSEFHKMDYDEIEKYHKRYGKTLNEDTIKQDGKWVNKGKEGTHGKFKTKKEADAQRKAMFANGYKESLKEAHPDIMPFEEWVRIRKHKDVDDLSDEEYYKLEDKYDEWVDGIRSSNIPDMEGTWMPESLNKRGI